MAPTTTPEQQQQAQALQQASRQQILTLQRKAELAAVTLWASYQTHNDAALADFLRQWLPFLGGAQRAVGALTQTYLNQSVRVLAGVPDLPPATVAPELYSGAVVRGGADPTQVYTRPFVQFWSDLSQKKPVDAALASAQARLKSMTAADVQLAHTHAARATLSGMPEGARVTGYRRVLGDASPCGLCVTAASQRYKKSALMPIHNQCHCTVWPIIGTKDLGQVVNTVAVLDNPPADGITDHFGDKVVIHQHGEMGPLLTASGQHFMTENSALRRSP